MFSQFKYRFTIALTLSIMQLFSAGLSMATDSQQSTQLGTLSVSGERPDTEFLLTTGAVDVIEPDETPEPPANALDLLKNLPGVAENGQGGHFQTYSIRGLSGHRVMSMVGDMRITGERRAGVSASFIDPLLLDNAQVLRGSLTTFYGSGSMGGVVKLEPAFFDGTTLRGGYMSNGNQHYELFSHGSENWSFGVSRRESGDTETANGETLPSHFTQYSATLAGEWSIGDLDYSLLAIPALAKDVGKPNTSYPEKTTTYPEERHLLTRFSVRSDNGWGLQLYAHPNDLETKVVKEGDSRSYVYNDATDMGANLFFTKDLGSFNSVFGFDYFGRKNVQAEERIIPLDDSPVSDSTPLDSAFDDEVALFTSIQTDWLESTQMQLAARLIYHRQGNKGSPTTDENALTAHLGVSHWLTRDTKLDLNLANGVRFPTLSELYYTGTTGRGYVIGNPQLEHERSLSLDLGLQWERDDLAVDVRGFLLDIDDFIERVEIDTDLLSYVNLTSGEIKGIEVTGSWRQSDNLSFRASGQWTDGESADGEQLSDIPAHRFRVSANYDHADWRTGVQLEYRADDDSPGSGEKAIPSATLLSAFASYHWNDSVQLNFNANNLLDEAYFNSADKKAVHADGRSIGMDLIWHL